MRHDIREVGHFQVLEIYETIDFYNLQDFKTILLSMIDGRYTHVAVELKGNTEEMSSGVIGALVVAQKKFNALKGTLILVNVGETVRNVLHVAGLDGFFNIADNISELM